MLAGEPPFTGPTAQAIIARRFTETPRPLREVRETVPASGRARRGQGARQVAGGPVRQRGGVRAGARRGAARSQRRSRCARRPRRRAPARPPRASRHAPRRLRFPLTAALAIGFLLGLGVLFGWLRSHGRADDSAAGAKRLAVLPFENLGAAEDEYFADGVTDEVRGKLAVADRAPGDRAEQLGAVQEDEQDAAGDRAGAGGGLSAHRHGAVGEGGGREPGAGEPRADPGRRRPRPRGSSRSTRRSPTCSRCRPTSPAGWPRRWTWRSGAPQKKTLAEKPTENLAAYEAFLKGEEASQGLASNDVRAIRRAIDYYGQAVALDSAFVHAWVQLSRAHSSIYNVGTPAPADADGARDAAERARRLAPERPEIQLALGDYQQFVRNDAAAALAAYEAGLAEGSRPTRNCSAPPAASSRASGAGRPPPSATRRPAPSIPRSVLNARRQGVALLWLRRYPEADAAFDRGLAISPGTLPALFGQGHGPPGSGRSAGCASRAPEHSTGRRADRPRRQPGDVLGSVLGARR